MHCIIIVDKPVAANTAATVKPSFFLAASAFHYLNYLQYLATFVPFQLPTPQSGTLKPGSPRFHLGPDHQCRLFQTFAYNIFVCSILVHSAR